MSANPDLLATWIRGWAVTRDVSPPAWDDGGWRVEVGQDDQVRRYVFAEAGEAAARRAAAVTEPRVFLKVCAEEAFVRAFLPEGWILKPPGFLMVLEGWMTKGSPPSGYQAVVSREDEVIFCSIRTASGAEAARGRAVVVEGRVIYDRIAVEPDHRRKGLGGQLMRALEIATNDFSSHSGQGVLVATDDGFALYQTLGWRLHSPYTTAVRPA